MNTSVWMWIVDLIVFNILGIYWNIGILQVSLCYSKTFIVFMYCDALYRDALFSCIVMHDFQVMNMKSSTMYDHTLTCAICQIITVLTLLTKTEH